MRPDVGAYLKECFAAHGPISGDALSELLNADVARLNALRLQACQDLLPVVLGDATACGTTGLEVSFSANVFGEGGGLIMEVRHPSWTSGRWYGENEPDGEGSAVGWDADALVWLATGIQEAGLLGPLPEPPRFWPLCSQHGASVHPGVVVGLALWWCSGGEGHEVSPIGSVAPTS